MTLGQLATLASAVARLSHVALDLTVPQMSQDL
jgi:hypothetical protein